MHSIRKWPLLTKSGLKQGLKTINGSLLLQRKNSTSSLAFGEENWDFGDESTKQASAKAEEVKQKVRDLEAAIKDLKSKNGLKEDELHLYQNQRDL